MDEKTKKQAQQTFDTFISELLQNPETIKKLGEPGYRYDHMSTFNKLAEYVETNPEQHYETALDVVRIIKNLGFTEDAWRLGDRVRYADPEYHKNNIHGYDHYEEIADVVPDEAKYEGWGDENKALARKRNEKALEDPEYLVDVAVNGGKKGSVDPYAFFDMVCDKIGADTEKHLPVVLDAAAKLIEEDRSVGNGATAEQLLLMSYKDGLRGGVKRDEYEAIFKDHPERAALAELIANSARLQKHTPLAEMI